MYNYDIKILREKIKETNVSSSNKWQVSNTMPLVHILSLSAHAPLWKMARKKSKKFSTNREVYQFQVACVSYLNLKKNKAFKEKIKHNSTSAISMIMFYEKKKTFILKLLGVVVYCFIKKYVCVDYLCLQREAKLLLLHRVFEDTSFYELSGISIT